MKTEKLFVTFCICFIITIISASIYALIDGAKQISKDRLQQETFNNFIEIDDLIYEITIDGHAYIVNKHGGILLKP